MDEYRTLQKGARPPQQHPPPLFDTPSPALPGGFKTAQEASKTVPGGPQDRPRGPRDAQRSVHDAQDSPKTAQEAPKTPQEASKRLPKRAPRGKHGWFSIGFEGFCWFSPFRFPEKARTDGRTRMGGVALMECVAHSMWWALHIWRA